MKEKLYKILSKPIAVVIVIILATILSIADRNFGYFFGIGICLFLSWKENWNWKKFGFGKRINKKTVLSAIGWTILMVFVVNICIEPFLEMYFGRIDLSSVDDIRGDFLAYSILMIVVWTFAAFGEELLFRGYYMKRFAELFGNDNRAWLISAILIAIYFGVSHNYQGTSGMIAVGILGLFQAIIFYKNRTNLMLGVLVHGFYDTIGLTLIYSSKERIFADWIERIILG